jgi:acetyl-CoA carboxylase biotin carboxyl carrier protein
MMNLDELKQILDIVREHELTEFELEQEGLKLRVKKGGAVVAAGPIAPLAVAAAPGAAAAASVPATLPAAAPVAVPSPAPAGGDEMEVELAVVKSPIVGTFFRAPEPGAAPFTDIGAPVKKGQVLCIIEAMKLMNEIESEYDGEVAKIYIENGQPVQYGERLFAIKVK